MKGVRIDCEIFVNCRYGYDIQCQIVGEEGVANLPEPMAIATRKEARLGQSILTDWKDRFKSAFDAELQDFVDRVPAARPAARPPGTVTSQRSRPMPASRRRRPEQHRGHLAAGAPGALRSEGTVMDFAINHISVPKLSVQDFFAMVRRLGQDKVEIRNDIPDVMNTVAPGDVKAAAEAAGVTILSINALYPFNVWSGDLPERAEKMADYAAGLRCQGAGDVSAERRHEGVARRPHRGAEGTWPRSCASGA